MAIMVNKVSKFLTRPMLLNSARIHHQDSTNIEWNILTVKTSTFMSVCGAGGGEWMVVLLLRPVRARTCLDLFGRVMMENRKKRKGK